MRWPILLFLSLPVMTAVFVSEPISSQAAAQDTSRARLLLNEADAIQSRREFPRKAKLYEDAAGLFPKGTKDGEAALRSAAALHYHLGHHRRAQQLLERAGDQATYRGDVAAAADAYINAVFVALQREVYGDARRLIEQTRVLAAAPTLSESERAAILRRLSQPVATVTVK